MNDLICPISFVNGEQAKTKDLNELFIAGYRDKVCNDFGHSIMLDEIKGSFDYKDLTPDQSAWLTDVNRYEYAAFNDSILSYIINNVVDLTVNTLILFMQELSMPDSLMDVNVDQIFSELDIRRIINNAVAELFNDGFVRGESPEQTFLLIDMRMNSLYSVIVTRVFNAYIDLFMSITLKCSGIDELFGTLFLIVYNSAEYPADQSYSNKYVFCTTILREALDRQTMNFRLGLKRIAEVATAMINQAPKYAQQIFEPNYVTDFSEYQKSSLFNGPEHNRLGVHDEEEN